MLVAPSPNKILVPASFLDINFEIYLKCNLEICINRDNKGIYNDNSNIIGKDLDFQEPKQYDIMLNSEKYY